MKSIVEGDNITPLELTTMTVEELKALAKANGIKLYTTKKGKMIDYIYSIWQSRLRKGDAFRY